MKSITMKEATEQIFDNASIQTSDLPEELIKQVRDIQIDIPRDILYDGEDDIFVENGIQLQLHITLLYGVANDIDISSIINKYPEINIEATDIDYFDSENYTVAIVKHKSPELIKLHDELKGSIENKDSYAEYMPHTTIAYLKKGERISSDFKPTEWVITEYEIVKTDGSMEII